MSDLQFNTLVQMFSEQGKQIAGIHQDVVTGFAAISKKFKELDKRLNKLEKGLVSLRKEMVAELSKVREEMAREFAKVHQEMADEFAGVRQEMASEFARVDGELTTLRQLITTGLATQEAISQEILKAIHGPFQDLETEVFTIKSLHGKRLTRLERRTGIL